MRKLLVPSILLLVSCVSLPDTKQQAINLAQQPFDPEYKFAITSYYNDTNVRPSDAELLTSSYNPYPRTILREMFTTALDRSYESLQWSVGASQYNRGDFVSKIEQRFANALETALRITPVFLARSEIQEKLDDELLETSTMIHAKKLAVAKGYDAILVVYFTPVLTKKDIIMPGFKLSYQAEVALRSVKEDKLLFFNSSDYQCTENQVSSFDSKQDEVLDAMNACEEEIHSAIISDFLNFAETAGIRLAR